MQNMEMSRFCKRGSSLLSCLSMVCLLSASTVRAEEEVSSAIYWSESEIALNAQVSDEKMTPNPVKINYSADYLARNLSEDEALCLQYALLDDASGAWQTIQVLSNSDGEYSWQCDIGEANCVKIRLVVSNTEGEITDEISSAVLSFEIASSESALVFSVDTFEDSFQRAAEKGEAVDIMYDSEWFAINGVSKLELGYVLTRPASGGGTEESEFVVWEKTAPASGIETMKLPFRYGEFRWQLKAFGKDGEPIADALSASYANNVKFFTISLQ